MPLYRHALPQLSGWLFLTEAGLKIDLIFNRGITIREFAAHPNVTIPAVEAPDYFDRQNGLATRDQADMVSGMTVGQASEGIGLVRAACGAGMPAAPSLC